MSTNKRITIKVSIEVKKKLDSIKIHPREPYSDLIARIFKEYGVKNA